MWCSVDMTMLRYLVIHVFGKWISSFTKDRIRNKCLNDVLFYLFVSEGKDLLVLFDFLDTRLCTSVWTKKINSYI